MMESEQTAYLICQQLQISERKMSLELHDACFRGGCEVSVSYGEFTFYQVRKLTPHWFWRQETKLLLSTSSKRFSH